ncbi:MAG: hypothetical protein JWR17_1077 [Pseudomonas sp.]|jgi:hypothetical protein|uniref:DUF4426 domain-containing protein n=1 Tax=Pseudomonas sp. TaxID=306 RepID=UPI0026050C0E|nr:DUF4426 domain-containing protein [Pseudomonas sp.]MDB6048331.1 hypothetical protein [Pseudomonas sp.]
MRRLALFLCAFCLAIPAFAADYAKPDRQEVFGDTTVHYSAISSSYLQPEIASAAGLIRSKNQGVLIIVALKAGKPAVANITGTVKDLTGRKLPLVFKQIADQGAMDYIAQFPIEQQETLTFDINVKAGDDANSFSFDQELFPGE